MILALILFLVAASEPTKVTHRVQLDGKTYRVTVKGRAVTVADKSIITSRDPERGAVLRRAVQVATGCEMKDGYWEGAKMRGLLECGSGQP